MSLLNYIKVKEEDTKTKEEKLKKLRKFCLEYLKNDPLWKNAKNLVFGDGKINNIVIIGEAPGENEDKEGQPFVGKAGKLLRSVLEELGIEAYITNLLKLRPPNNRNPTKEEIERHKFCLLKQLEIIKPDIIITLGNFASKFVLADFDTKKMKYIDSISKINGQIFKKELFGKRILVIPIYHPAAVLYNPKLKEKFIESFRKIKDIINQTS